MHNCVEEAQRVKMSLTSKITGPIHSITLGYFRSNT